MKQETKELRSKPLGELQKLLDEARERLVGLRFDLAQGKVKNVRELKAVKKDVARLSTLIRERQGKE